MYNSAIIHLYKHFCYEGTLVRLLWSLTAVPVCLLTISNLTLNVQRVLIVSGVTAVPTGGRYLLYRQVAGTNCTDRYLLPSYIYWTFVSRTLSSILFDFD
jgi:hypothetical protein